MPDTPTLPPTPTPAPSPPPTPTSEPSALRRLLLWLKLLPENPTPTSEPSALLRSVSGRLFVALFLLPVIVLLIVGLRTDAPYVVLNAVIGSGIIGGFVGLQRRLKDLTLDDLQLMQASWVYTALSPLVGGILALLLYVLFLSGLVSGQMFPIFEANSEKIVKSFHAVLNQHGHDYTDYAKLVFWSFVAGYSEHFVTDVISRFEGTAVKDLPERRKPQAS